MKFNKIKNVKREYLISLLLFIVIFGIFVGILPRIFGNELQKCIEEKQGRFPSNNDTIMRGHIVVAFKDNVNESEAFNLIYQHGLDMNGLRGRFLVYVPSGDEHKWICILENSEIVEYAAIDYSTKG
jgi:hypothetical protein